MLYLVTECEFRIPQVWTLADVSLQMHECSRKTESKSRRDGARPIIFPAPVTRHLPAAILNQLSVLFFDPSFLEYRDRACTP